MHMINMFSSYELLSFLYFPPSWCMSGDYKKEKCLFKRLKFLGGKQTPLDSRLCVKVIKLKFKNIYFLFFFK